MKILIVEDNFSMRHQLLCALAGQGYLVDMVFSKEDAVCLLMRFKYSLVILGAGFTDLYASELADELWSRTALRPQLLRLVVEGDANNKRMAGVDDVLHLPASSDQLSDRLALKIRELL